MGFNISEDTQMQNQFEENVLNRVKQLESDLTQTREEIVQIDGIGFNTGSGNDSVKVCEIIESLLRAHDDELIERCVKAAADHTCTEGCEYMIRDAIRKLKEGGD